jgi:uncharacterized membrane protein
VTLDAASKAPVGPRYDRLDALRGAAVLWMAAFHFCFDLDHFRYIHQDFHADPFWTVQRTCIVGLFLVCAGAGQAIAFEQGQQWSRFWRRWAQVAGCALLVSAGSYLVFPKSWISFGVLHFVAVALVLLRLAAPVGRGLWLLGLLALALPLAVQSHLFDTRWTNGIGLVTRKPVTEDYVPLLPWFGLVCLANIAGRWLLERQRAFCAAPLAPVFAPLAVLGRWSLSFYMLHQPVFFALLTAWSWVRR